MYGYSLDFTSTFAPIGWLIVSLMASALVTAYVQRARRPVELGSPEIGLRRAAQEDRLAA